MYYNGSELGISIRKMCSGAFEVLFVIPKWLALAK